MSTLYEQLTSETYKSTFFDASAPHALIDVRQPDEYAEARIPGAVLIPLGELEARIAEVPTDLPVVLVCRSGGRSAMAAELLRSKQFSGTLYNLEGGTMGWVRAGNAYDSGEA
ncbi:MAG: rhodanese-like domain-containing protein [Anaerolineae bacterium]|jgi:rhodanese-related sulfurtransferase|nr:rhodanese-like domain-containing protein [Anaerolineae bacterium]